MNVFQWVFLIFCGVQLVTALARVRRTHSAVAVMFAGAWLAATVLLVHPPLATYLAGVIGIGRGADLVLYTLGFIFIWAHYGHYVRYRRLEENVTQLVRELAIERAMKTEQGGRAIS